MKMDRIKCSLVRTVSGGPGISFGHVIALPDFGRIFLGELTVERKDNAHTFHLSMIRLELDSAAKGTTRIVNVDCNGGATPEVKSEREQSDDMEGPPFGQILGPGLGLVTERL